MALAIKEKYDHVRQLINMGKERGYLLYDEVNDILPAEVHSSEEIDDLLSTFERYGIDIYEDVSSAKAARAAMEAAQAVEAGPKEELPTEEIELDPTPGTLERTNDLVWMYLREMGTAPLLTREGEVAIAKRVEGGQMLVLKTIPRSPIVLKELLAIGEELRKGTRSIKEIVQFGDEELTEEKIENKTRQTLLSTRSRSFTTWRSSRPPSWNARRSRRSASICGPGCNWGGRASRCRNWSARSTSTRSRRSV